MQRVYIETTIPSLLVARPSRDVITAARQMITAEWWRTARERFELVISEAVLDEISAGEPAMAQKRLEAVQGLRTLALSAEVQELARHYQEHVGLPAKAAIDVLHIAFAVAYEIDYLLTWNCAHIANEQVQRRLQKLNDELGRPTPRLVTPDLLSAGALESNNGQ